MFVVRRQFTDATGIHTVGSVIDSTVMKNFKARLRNGYIIRITEHNYSTYAIFFKRRYGVVIPKLQKSTVAKPKTKAKAAAAKSTAKVKATVK